MFLTVFSNIRLQYLFFLLVILFEMLRALRRQTVTTRGHDKVLFVSTSWSTLLKEKTSRKNSTLQISRNIHKNERKGE